MIVHLDVVHKYFIFSLSNCVEALMKIEAEVYFRRRLQRTLFYIIFGRDKYKMTLNYFIGKLIFEM